MNTNAKNSNATKKTGKIILKILSVILSVVFVLAALGATAISGVRSFFEKGTFESMVSELKLSDVKFTANGKNYTASDYIYEMLSTVMPDSIKNYTNKLSNIFGDSVNNAIQQLISSNEVDNIVKTTMTDCVDYYLNSDVKEAKKQLKQQAVIADNSEDYKDVKDLQEAIRIYIRQFVVNTVENTAGMDSNRIIILLSKSTRNTLVAAAVISAILILLCNLSSIPELLLYFGGSSFVYGVVIKIFQNKFESAQTDKTLIGYQLLKPLADSYSPNAIAGIIAGIIMICLLAVLAVILKPEKKESEKS